MMLVTTAVHQHVELLVQRWADGHQRQAALDDDDGQHAFNRRVGLAQLGEDFREEAAVGGGFEHLSDGELPAEQRADAGHDHQRHDDLADRRVEHVENASPNGAVELARSMFGTMPAITLVETI